MRENIGKKIKLRPKLVAGITASFMIVSTLVSSMAVINNSVNVKRIGNGDDVVRAMEEDPTANWDLNKVWVYTDPDGVKVPVPIGFTASGAESEKYVNHNVTKTGTISNLIFSSSGDYAWTQDENNVWVSGNYNVHSTTSELVSDEITVGEDGGYLSIEWSVSSQGTYDLLSITITNTDTGTSESPTNISGANFGITYNSLIYTKYNVELEEGKYVVAIKYTKDKSGNSGLDRGYVKGGTILNYDSIGEDEVTIHEYSGLVIYEGNGEITDTNAWNESQIRNQFVWVPIKDTSRIYIKDSKEKRRAIGWDFNANGRTRNSYYEPSIAPGAGDDRIHLWLDNNLQEYTKDIFYKELVVDFNNTIDSIEKYGRILYWKI